MKSGKSENQMKFILYQLAVKVDRFTASHLDFDKGHS